MIAGWFKTFISAQTGALAAAAIGARTGSDPTVATLAELRAGSSTTTRAVNPQVLAQAYAADGTTASRPTDANVGFGYFDTTLGKPVWLKTAPSTWVDATGTAA